MSCSVGNLDLCFIAGDDVYYTVTFNDVDGVAKDLTGETATMELRNTVDTALVDTMSGGITDAVNGVMVFTLTDVETNILCPRASAAKSYKYSIKLTGVTDKTIIVGTLTFNQKATA